MALITTITNQASVNYGGADINSNHVVTTLLLPPTLLKTVDKLLASIGESLTYTIVITNVGLTTLTDLPFSDVIPAGADYIESSFTVNGSPETPTITDDTLSFTIPSISALGLATLSFQVEVVGGEE